MSLVVPCYSVVKAFYGLSALIPFCWFGAMGTDFLARRSTILRNGLCVMFGLWAINSYACFWISRSSAAPVIQHASALVQTKQYLEATDLLEQSLLREPGNADLRFTLAYFLTTTGRVDEGIREAGLLVQEHPDNFRVHRVLALAYAHEHQAGKAIEELRRIVTLAPGYDPSWEDFTSLLIEPGHADETVDVCRQALAMAPFNSGLRLALGTALLFQDQEAEASAQLRYACLLNPKSADTLTALAWRLATRPQPAERNGTAAIKLAEHAYALTGNSNAIGLDVLAAAYAEAGRYAEAINTAGQRGFGLVRWRLSRRRCKPGNCCSCSKQDSLTGRNSQPEPWFPARFSPTMERTIIRNERVDRWHAQSAKAFSPLKKASSACANRACSPALHD